MTAQQKVETPAWVFPGARVIVEISKRSVTVGVIDVVKAVGQAWITLENEDVRIKIKDLQSAHQGSSYDGRRLRLIEPGTEEGQRLLLNTRVHRATNRLARTVETWKQNPHGKQERAELRDALDCLDARITKAGQ